MEKITFICIALIVLVVCATIVFPSATDCYSTASISIEDKDITDEDLLVDVKDVYDETDEDTAPVEDEDTAATDAAVPDEEPTTSDAAKEDPPATVAAEKAGSSYCSYCGFQDHSSNCPQRSVDNGAYGRWVVPSAGINVAAYYTGVNGVQSVVDAMDSACLTSCAGVSFLADHSNQGFSTLKSVTVGAKAYMDIGSYRQEYICTDFSYGHNDGYAVCDSNYNQLSFESFSPGTLVCYTCNGCWQNIILVTFRQV